MLLISGDLGSAHNSGSLLKWLLSWFPPLSPAQFNLLHFYVRKTIGHFGNYACLYFLWFRACRGQLRWTSGRALFLAIGLCLAMAFTDEGHQLMLGSRSSSLRDVGLDLSGAATAALASWIIWPHRLGPQAGK